MLRYAIKCCEILKCKYTYLVNITEHTIKLTRKNMEMHDIPCSRNNFTKNIQK